MNKMLEKVKNVAETIAVTMFIQGLVFAVEYGAGTQDTIKNFFNNTITFLTTIVGGGVFVGGMVWTGIMMAQHKEDALKRGGMVIFGGLIILLARVIWNILAGLTGMGR